MAYPLLDNPPAVPSLSYLSLHAGVLHFIFIFYYQRGATALLVAALQTQLRLAVAQAEIRSN